MRYFRVCLTPQGSDGVEKLPAMPDNTDTQILQVLRRQAQQDRVVDRILALREETGDFGELVYAGMDWVDPALNKRSMQLMAEEVMPRVNAAIKEAAAAA